VAKTRLGNPAAKVTGVPLIISSTVNFWNYADTYESTPKQDFTWTSYVVPSGADDGGDFYESTGNAVQFVSSGDAVQFQKWTEWDSGETVDGDGNAISIKLGSPTTGTLPTLQADPCAPGTNYTWYASAIGGYSITDAKAVINWDFDSAGAAPSSNDYLHGPTTISTATASRVANHKTIGQTAPANQAGPTEAVQLRLQRIAVVKK
jgi:hypothetical protein